MTLQECTPCLLLCRAADGLAPISVLSLAGGPAHQQLWLKEGAVVQNKIVTEQPEVWRAGLRQLVPQAQQQRDDRMLRNPYLQMSAMLDSGLPDLAF